MERTTRDHVLQQFPYGLYVIGTANGPTVSTIVANWVTQVSFTPPLVAVGIEEDSRMRAKIEEAGFFAVNLLPAKEMAVARAFLKPRESSGDEINGRQFVRARNGMPFLKDALASIECRVVSSSRTGDHVLFVGEVTDASARHRGRGEVLTLKETGWRYHKKSGG